jgi:hypothetical protein
MNQRESGRHLCLIANDDARMHPLILSINTHIVSLLINGGKLKFLLMVDIDAETRS